MLQVIDEGKALDITGKYFNILSDTGYLKKGMMSRFVIYLFLLDFINHVHRFFTEEDYNAVDNALRKLFSNGGCLLPYSVFCVDKVTIGQNEYVGVLKNRITEDESGNEDRFTEDDNIRVI